MKRKQESQISIKKARKATTGRRNKVQNQLDQTKNEMTIQ